MTPPLIELIKVGRHFNTGAGPIAVLKDISLHIHQGEMVAIVGASGSGKSTLMNILGCLDRASTGSYRIDGLEVNTLAADDLSQLRRERFGFIFQSYHLLPSLTALANVAMPGLYLGTPKAQRLQRASALLSRLGLTHKLHLRPQQLSGGQQQRVSIARALMNGGSIILADEPTGALDRPTGQEVLNILRELQGAGHTIIIITHDPHVAASADRLIELEDGIIVNDPLPSSTALSTLLPPSTPATTVKLTGIRRTIDAFQIALLALREHRLRTALTMLGIIIGITAVVSIVALGSGARKKVLHDIRSISTQTIHVYRGVDWSDEKASSIDTLRPSDVSALSEQPYVDSVTPSISLAKTTLRTSNKHVLANAKAVGEDNFRVWGLQLDSGRLFDREDIEKRAQVAVIDLYTQGKLFGQQKNVIGQALIVGAMPTTIIGVIKKNKQDAYYQQQPTVWLPYSTATSYLLGRPYFDALIIRIRDGLPMTQAEARITQLLKIRHGSKDFWIYNADEMFKASEKTLKTLSIFLTCIAIIALLVGGIGVMNIMLVSVTERTREIGIRMAVGARRSDIRQQFLIESILVCLLGGGIGVVLSLSIGALFTLFIDDWAMIFAPEAILLAVGSSTLIGILFGYLPAQRAAKLDPIVALARE